MSFFAALSNSSRPKSNASLATWGEDEANALASDRETSVSASKKITVLRCSACNAFGHRSSNRICPKFDPVARERRMEARRERRRLRKEKKSQLAKSVEEESGGSAVVDLEQLGLTPDVVNNAPWPPPLASTSKPTTKELAIPEPNDHSPANPPLDWAQDVPSETSAQPKKSFHGPKSRAPVRQSTDSDMGIDRADSAQQEGIDPNSLRRGSEEEGAAEQGADFADNDPMQIDGQEAPQPSNAPLLKEERERIAPPLKPPSPTPSTSAPQAEPQYESTDFISPKDRPCFRVLRCTSASKGPHYLEILNTDGDKKFWPAIKKLTPDAKGHINGYVKIPHDSAEELRWRTTIGKELADCMQLLKNKNEVWLLKKLPAGYRLYDHVSGPPRRPERKPLLFGSNFAKPFPNPMRCIIHFARLMNDEEGACDCDMCEQRVRDAAAVVAPTKAYNLPNPSKTGGLGFLGGPLKPHATATSLYTYSHQHGFHQAPTTPWEEEARKTAQTIKRSKLLEKALDYAGPYVNHMRQEDLPHNAQGDWVRFHEMVWVRIESIQSSEPELAKKGVEVSWWPGIVIDRQFYATPPVSGSSSRHQKHPQPKEVVEWEIQLLAIEEPVWRTTSELVPWLGYKPAAAIFSSSSTTRESAQHIWSTSRQKTKRADLSDLHTFELALIPYAYALQQAACVVSCWSLLDAFKSKELPDEFRKLKDGKEDQGMIKNMKKDVVNYQGVFLGAEKMWTGDMVRLRTETMKELHLPVAKAILQTAEQKDTTWVWASHDLTWRKLSLLVNSIYCHQENGQIFFSGYIYELVPLPQGARCAPDWPVDYKDTLRPPPGWAFVRVTPQSTEHHVAIEHIAGRLYPSHGIRPPQFPPVEDDSLLKDWELPIRLCKGISGLEPGAFVYMKVKTWKPSRRDTLEYSDGMAEMDLTKLIQQTLGQPED